jgi:hypothetical protein
MEKVQHMMNIRKWLEGILGNAGAQITGGGIGLRGDLRNRADVEFTFDGRNYYLTVLDETPEANQELGRTG